MKYPTAKAFMARMNHIEPNAGLIDEKAAKRAASKKKQRLQGTICNEKKKIRAIIVTGGAVKGNGL